VLLKNLALHRFNSEFPIVIGPTKEALMRIARTEVFEANAVRVADLSAFSRMAEDITQILAEAWSHMMSKRPN
jgi:hypothetical protein